ncbi:MAG: trypsin-like peptidase domain-containing protein [Lachnospiraceae bacterium]|nr:trypsin-like peptidase domain-containing protein [Lachnospiraceae bacterium]
MYENNNNNGLNGTYTGQNANRTSYGTYMQNNPGYYASQSQFNPGNGDPGSGAPKKPVKKRGGMAKKLIAAASVGLMAGAFCAAGFIGVYFLGSRMGLINNKPNEDDNKPVAYSAAAQITPAATADTDKPTVTTVSSSSTKTVVSDVSEMVDDVMPSIVSITNNMTADYYYFSQEEEGRGSGIIIGQNDDELLLVTNYHVIADNDRLTVTFSNDSDAPALVKGTDAKLDLAVIAVKLDDIPDETMDYIEIASMGDSDALKVGEPAIAIGNALGYGLSVTTGVISAVDRKLDQDSVSGTFIQTDAAINPGNSGGALLNINGEVVGINSSKIGGAAVEGMGYAIPISAARPIIEDLMNKNTRTVVAEEDRGYLGISGISVSPEDALYYSLPEGVYVSSVTSGSAAEKGGILKDDIITGIEGTNVSTMDEFQKELAYYAAGENVSIEVQRLSGNSYKSVTLTVTLDDKSVLEDD